METVHGSGFLLQCSDLLDLSEFSTCDNKQTQRTTEYLELHELNTLVVKTFMLLA